MSLTVGGAATGASALVWQGKKNYELLRTSIDTGIERPETCFPYLQESLTSFSEVVLQNRRELDILFLQQGGLCAALH